MSPNCVFCNIAEGESSARLVFEDERLVAFEDLNPQAPRHILVIPRKHVPSLDALTEEDEALAGQLVLAATEVARQEGIADTGYRLVVNTGNDGGQAVHHVHFHLMGGRSFSWPPG